MVPSGPIVGEAPLPMPFAPGGGTGAVTSGVGPRCSPKSKVQRTVPASPPPEGGATAYSLPSILDRYTVPSDPSAGAALSDGPVWADQRTAPLGVTAKSFPLPLTA